MSTDRSIDGLTGAFLALTNGDRSILRTRASDASDDDDAREADLLLVRAARISIRDSTYRRKRSSSSQSSVIGTESLRMEVEPYLELCFPVSTEPLQ